MKLTDVLRIADPNVHKIYRAHDGWRESYGELDLRGVFLYDKSGDMYEVTVDDLFDADDWEYLHRLEKENEVKLKPSPCKYCGGENHLDCLRMMIERLPGGAVQARGSCKNEHVPKELTGMQRNTGDMADKINEICRWIKKKGE